MAGPAEFVIAMGILLAVALMSIGMAVALILAAIEEAFVRFKRSVLRRQRALK